jgi:hypothetical protein
VATDIWHLEDQPALAEFRAATMSTRLPSGIGLPGSVSRPERPAWIMDVTKDPGFLAPTSLRTWECEQDLHFLSSSEPT